MYDLNTDLFLLSLHPAWVVQHGGAVLAMLTPFFLLSLSEEQGMTEDSSISLTLHSLQLPFSNTWKYGILAIAILLLLVALTILACQVCQLQKRHRARKSKYWATVLSSHQGPVSATFSSQKATSILDQMQELSMASLTAMSSVFMLPTASVSVTVTVPRTMPKVP